KGSVLEPTNQQLLELIGPHIPAMETANICGPPRNPSQAHLQTGYHLIFQILIRGMNIPTPNQRPITLTTCPSTTYQFHGIFAKVFRFSFMESTNIFPRIGISLLQDTTGIVTISVIIIGTKLRFRFV